MKAHVAVFVAREACLLGAPLLCGLRFYWGFPVKQGAPKNEVGAPFGIIASVYIGIFGQVPKYRHSPRILALLVEQVTSDPELLGSILRTHDFFGWSS